MARHRDLRSFSTPSVELDPVELSSAVAGNDGQLVVTTDQGKKRLWVREGGALEPAIETEYEPGDVLGAISTKEDFTITVDYVNGIVPPDGTIVTNQAEYDALGGSIKYLQDAFYIIPLILDHWVTINLVAGNHYAKPGTGGTSTAALLYQQYLKRAKGSHVDSSKLVRYPCVMILGAVNNVYSGISGVSTNYGFTRDSGTWTAGELVGKRLLIESGAGAGAEVLIYENDETTLKVASKLTSVGTCTVSIQENASNFIPLYDGVGSPLTYGFYGLHLGIAQNSAHTEYRHINFGSATDRLGSVGFFPCMYTRYCTFYFSSIVNCAFDTSFFYHNHFDFNGSIPRMQNASGAGGAFTGCLWTGSPYGRFFWISGNVARPISLVDCVFIPDSVVEILTIDDSGCLALSGKCIFAGTGSCTGLTIRQNYPFVSGKVWFPNTTVIKNCSIAIRVQACFDSVQIQAFSAESTGNTVGIEVRNGSRCHVRYPENLQATHEINLDGVYYNYSDIPNAGDTLIGQYGSMIKKVNWY